MSKIDYQERYSFAFAATGTSLTTTITDSKARGKFWYALLKLPNFTNSITGGFDVLNSDGETIYSVDSKTKNAEHYVTPNCPLAEGYTLKATISGAAGGDGGTVYLNVYVEN
jgi:hypothetical protein